MRVLHTGFMVGFLFSCRCNVADYSTREQVMVQCIVDGHTLAAAGIKLHTYVTA